MTSIIESLLAVLKDFHWLVSIDMLLIFFVNYLMFHAAGRVKISWWLLLLGGLLSVVLTPLLPMGFKFLLNPLIFILFQLLQTSRLAMDRAGILIVFMPGGQPINHYYVGLSLTFFPLLLGDDFDEPHSRIFNGVYVVVVTYPLYLLVHRFIGYEYLQVEEKGALTYTLHPYCYWGQLCLSFIRASK